MCVCVCECARARSFMCVRVCNCERARSAGFVNHFRCRRLAQVRASSPPASPTRPVQVSPFGRVQWQQVLLRAPPASGHLRCLLSGRAGARLILQALLCGHLSDQVHDMLRAERTDIVRSEDLCAPSQGELWFRVCGAGVRTRVVVPGREWLWLVMSSAGDR